MQEGLRLQQAGEYSEAIVIFDKVIELDPHRETAHNSKGLTLKYAGRFEDAIKSYEIALDALCGNIFRLLVNERSNLIYQHENLPEGYATQWIIKTAMYTATIERGISSIAFPDGEGALKEAQDKHHEGLLWIDRKEVNGILRYFLPNYFNTMRERLKHGRMFARILNNLGCAYLGLNQPVKASQTFCESIIFIPDGDDYDMPYLNLYDLQQKG